MLLICYLIALITLNSNCQLIYNRIALFSCFLMENFSANEVILYLAFHAWVWIGCNDEKIYNGPLPLEPSTLYENPKMLWIDKRTIIQKLKHKTNTHHVMCAYNMNTINFSPNILLKTSILKTLFAFTANRQISELIL